MIARAQTFSQHFDAGILAREYFISHRAAEIIAAEPMPIDDALAAASVEWEGSHVGH